MTGVLQPRLPMLSDDFPTEPVKSEKAYRERCREISCMYSQSLTLRCSCSWAVAITCYATGRDQKKPGRSL
jgi:hypothetical protein